MGKSFTNPSIQKAIFYEEWFLKAKTTVKMSSFRECHLSKQFFNLKDNCPQRVIFVPTTNISLWLRKQKIQFFHCSKFEKEKKISCTLNHTGHWYKYNYLVWVLKCFSSSLNQSITLSKILPWWLVRRKWYYWAHHFLLFSRLSKLFLWKIISCFKKQLKVLGRLLHLDLAKIGSNPKGKVIY